MPNEPFGNPFANNINTQNPNIPNPFALPNNPFNNDNDLSENPFQNNGEIDVDELLKKIDAKIAELEEEERLEKEKNNKSDKKEIDNKPKETIEEFKLPENNTDKTNDNIEQFSFNNNVPKTFDEIMKNNSTTKSDNVESKKEEKIVMNDNNVTDDQFFDDFFGDE